MLDKELYNFSQRLPTKRARSRAILRRLDKEPRDFSPKKSSLRRDSEDADQRAAALLAAPS
jgi:hypothetical protein